MSILSLETESLQYRCNFRNHNQHIHSVSIFHTWNTTSILLLLCLRCSSHRRRDTRHPHFSFFCCHKCWFYFIRLIRDMITINVGVWRFTIRNIFPFSFSYCLSFVFSYSLVFSYFFIFLLFCVTSSSFL